MIQSEVQAKWKHLDGLCGRFPSLTRTDGMAPVFMTVPPGPGKVLKPLVMPVAYMHLTLQNIRN